jgi:hypothetical protein
LIGYCSAKTNVGIIDILKDCEPPLTCITASVLPWVGRTAPSASGIQS